jgi:hypothetical protein
MAVEANCGLKRLALQIAAQLPTIREESLLVLEFARELVEWENRPADDPAPVLKLVRQGEGQRRPRSGDNNSVGAPVGVAFDPKRT